MRARASELAGRQVSVIGEAAAEAEVLELAEEVGRWLAEAGRGARLRRPRRRDGGGVAGRRGGWRRR